MIKKIGKIILVMICINIALVLGVCGCSFLCSAEEVVNGADEIEAGTTAHNIYTESYILEMIERFNIDEMRDFWFMLIDTNDNVSLDIFFSNLDYGDKNYYLYLPDEQGRNSIERARQMHSWRVGWYLFGIQQYGFGIWV